MNKIVFTQLPLTLANYIYIYNNFEEKSTCNVWLSSITAAIFTVQVIVTTMAALITTTPLGNWVCGKTAERGVCLPKNVISGLALPAYRVDEPSMCIKPLVWLVPCGPRRDKPNLTAAMDRYCMCETAVNTAFSPGFPVKVFAMTALSHISFVHKICPQEYTFFFATNRAMPINVW